MGSRYYRLLYPLQTGHQTRVWCGVVWCGVAWRGAYLVSVLSRREQVITYPADITVHGRDEQTRMEKTQRAPTSVFNNLIIFYLYFIIEHIGIDLELGILYLRSHLI